MVPGKAGEGQWKDRDTDGPQGRLERANGRIGILMVPGKAGEGQWKDRDTEGSREAGEGQ